MLRRKFEVSERIKQIICWSIIGGILLGLFLDAKSKPLVFIQEAQATTTPERVVQIRVEIDWTPERIEQEIRNTFPERQNEAVAIAWAESELNPRAFNPEAHRGCNGSIGIMQIACVHNRKDPEQLKDIAFNLKKARAVYDEAKARTGDGFNPWGGYTDGRYKTYLE